jgi:Ca2+-binding RTX toxin-like protein
MAIFNGTAGADSFAGADAEADSFRFTPANLGAEDTVIGGGGVALDILALLGAGALSAAQLGAVSGIERIQHHAGGNVYALTAALVAGAVGTFEVRGANGADSVDGSALLDPLLRVSFVAFGGADTLIGGAGNDSFSVLLAFAGTRLFAGGEGDDQLVTSPAAWSGASLFQGGAGTDRLVFNASGSVAAASLAGLASVEEIQLGNALSITLALNDAAVAQAGGTLAVLGGATGAQLVDASAVTAGGVRYTAGTGADTFLGGAGDDRFEVTEAFSTGDLGAGDDVLRLTSKLAQGILVAGGAGHDVVELFAGGVWDLTGLSGFEEVELLAASTLALPATEGFRVLGSGAKDVITLGAPRQTVSGFGGDDIVAITAATMLGSVLSGGSHASQDVLRLDAAGTYDFRRAVITGFEKIEQVAVPNGFSSISLANQPVEVVLRHSSLVAMGANAAQMVWGSSRNDGIVLGALGQFADGGAGSDNITGAPAFLGAGTLLAGGPGQDTLTIRFAGAGETANLATGAVVTGIERIQILPDTGSPGLTLTLDATAAMEIQGGAGADTVTAGGAGLFGALGPGDDLLRLPPPALAGAATLDGGAGTDTLAILDTSAALLNLVLPARFSGFERLDLAALTNAAVTIQGAEARDVLLGAGAMTVTGGDGAEAFENPAAANAILAGGGADTIRQTAFITATQVLDGGGGDDVIFIDMSAADPETNFLWGQMSAGIVTETLRLAGRHVLTANAQAGMAIIGDPTLPSSITLRGNGQSALGGSGADTLQASAGLQTRLEGGNGADVYVTGPAEQTLWDTPGRVIADTAQAFVLNILRIEGAGSLRIDVEEHAISHLDRIDVASANAAVHLTLTSALAAQADANNGGGTGDFSVIATVPVTAGALVDAAAFTATQGLLFGGTFTGADTVFGGAGGDTVFGGDGADTVLAGAGPDTVNGDAGNDTLAGGDGNDTLRGGGDADSMTGGEGRDLLLGGTGGDAIGLAESVPVRDAVIYFAPDEGTADINDSASIVQASADAITAFDTALDKVQLSRSGLGLNSFVAQVVPANGAWNMSAAAVFLFESDSGNSDVLSNSNFADFNAIAFAINTDNGLANGSAAGLTVALAISNIETAPTRATGVYLWTDTDGDAVLEAGDVVRLLGVFHGVTANQMAAGGAIEIIT